MQPHIKHTPHSGIEETHRVTRYFRASRVATHILVGVLVAFVLMPVVSKSAKLRITKWWSGRLLVAFNLRVICHGHTPLNYEQLSKTIFVANHISWTDIQALNSIISLRFIAKSDIENWPVLKFLIKGANTIFIDRSKRQDAARTLNVAVLSLKSGDNLCFFPEGTTTDGTEIKPFKSSLMQAAIDANATIRPVAIRYPNLDGSINTGVAYAGETTMLESIQSILLQKSPVVELHFLEPIKVMDVTKKDRRELTLFIQQQIQQTLDLSAS